MQNYPLITQKWADFILFKKVFFIIQNNEHLTVKGLKQIISIKASQNKGLSPKQKAEFPDVSPVARPIVKDPLIKDPFWLAGFTSAEGCFLVLVAKSNTTVIGRRVQLVFTLTQHSRDE